MFTDIKTSRDAMQSFKQHQANAASTSGAADDIDLAVQVRRYGNVSMVVAVCRACLVFKYAFSLQQSRAKARTKVIDS